MKTISSKSVIWESGTALRLLLFFLENPTQEFYEKQVKEKTELSLGAVNKYLDELSKENLLILKRRGRMKFLKLNRENTFVKHLKIAYNLSHPAIYKLTEFREKLKVRIYLYGSVARGEDVEDSDWDLLMIGNIKQREVEKELMLLRNEFNIQLKATVFTEDEWIKMSEKDPAFYERVERDKIELI